MITQNAIPITILGTGHLATEVASFIEKYTERDYFLRGYISSSAKDLGKILGNGEVIGTDGWRRTGVLQVIGVGSPQLRAKIHKKNPHAHWVKSFSFTNYLSPDTMLGEGAVVAPGVITTNGVIVGAHCYLNLSVTIGHNTWIDDFTVINPGAHISGEVEIGTGVLIGTGAVILEGLKIGKGAIVGAGAVVTKNVPANTTVVGVPATPLTKGEKVL